MEKVVIIPVNKGPPKLSLNRLLSRPAKVFASILLSRDKDVLIAVRRIKQSGITNRRFYSESGDQLCLLACSSPSTSTMTFVLIGVL